MSYSTRFLYARTMANIPERIRDGRRARRLRVFCLSTGIAIVLFYVAVAAWQIMGAP